MKNPRRDQNSSFVSLCTFRESNTNKVSISDYTFNFVLLVPTGVENNAYAKLWREVQEYYCIFEKGILYSRLMEKQEFVSGVWDSYPVTFYVLWGWEKIRVRLRRASTQSERNARALENHPTRERWDEAGREKDTPFSPPRHRKTRHDIHRSCMIFIVKIILNLLCLVMAFAWIAGYIPSQHSGHSRHIIPLPCRWK